MANPEEVIEKLTAQFEKSALPAAFIGGGTTVTNPSQHIIVGLDHEPEGDEGAGAPTELDGETIEYLVFGNGEPKVWTPPQAAP